MGHVWILTVLCVAALLAAEPAAANETAVTAKSASSPYLANVETFNMTSSNSGVTYQIPVALPRG